MISKDEFAKYLQECAKKKKPMFAPIVHSSKKNYIGMIEGFEEAGYLHSFSGLGLQVVCLWLALNGRTFTIKYHPKVGVWTVRARVRKNVKQP